MTISDKQNKANLDRDAHLEARAYSQIIAWPTVLLGVTVFTCYWAIPLLVIFHELSLFIAIPLMAILTYAAYTVLHEAVHYCISGNKKSLRWLNNWMGTLAATILMVPLVAHRYLHLVHHQNTNQRTKDPDIYSRDVFSSLTSFFYAIYQAVAGQYKSYITKRWHTAPVRQNCQFILETFCALLLRAVPFAIAISIGGAEMQQTIVNLLMLFIGGGFIGTFLLVFLFAYIVHRPHQISDRYLNTSTIVISGPLSWPVTILWGFQNYHAVHHLFPWVPFYYYRHLFKRIRPTMELMGAPIYQLNWRGLRQVSVS